MTAKDRIEKKILLHTPRERVWRAIASYRQFGSWFGVALDDPFVEGARITGRIVPTTVDDEVAKLQKPHEGTPFEFIVDRIEPPHRFSFRWHPFAIDPQVDYSDEPTTLVTFTLDEVPGGTLLTLTESGFERLPAERREEAMPANEGGWAKQMLLIEKYLAVHVG
jgi:uncharacterized protein YndB with AHSA1/START domain